MDISLDSFEKRVFYFSSIFSALFGAIGAIFAYLNDIGELAIWLFGINCINNLILTVANKKIKSNTNAALYYFVCNGLIVFYAWYAFENVNNLVNLYAIVLMVQARIMLNHMPRLVDHMSLFFSFVLILFHVTAMAFPEVMPVPKPELVIFDFICITMAYVFISSTIRHFNDQVKSEQRTVQEQKEELATQNEELQVNNEELFANQEEILAQREAIEKHHDELQKINNNLLHSINYANRIQTALFSSSVNMLDSNRSFIISKPKDIVSGDFCFVREVRNITYIIQGDCTGHGVPGAILTVIASEILDKIIVDKHCWSPKKILTRLDEEMSFRLKHENRANLDGLEAGVLAIDNNLNVALYSGAKRPLIYWKSEENDYEIIKGTKKAVGNSMNVESEYREEVFKVNKGDRFYLFSDGYVDQFGGDENKKYSKKRFFQKVSELSGIHISEQGSLLTEEFESWKGDTRQIDDVMVLGIEV
ncbi:SpoIIE family protein phosphatase [Limibacter armeniacum]|uniref:PP2C family protein-serine/threonine phosphatase n=1 Tax=Limibacter armeniacum TaxID=466084 RepID=UPI002FE659C3